MKWTSSTQSTNLQGHFDILKPHRIAESESPSTNALAASNLRSSRHPKNISNTSALFASSHSVGPDKLHKMLSQLLLITPPWPPLRSSKKLPSNLTSKLLVGEISKKKIWLNSQTNASEREDLPQSIELTNINLLKLLITTNPIRNRPNDGIRNFLHCKSVTLKLLETPLFLSSHNFHPCKKRKLTV